MNTSFQRTPEKSFTVRKTVVNNTQISNQNSRHGTANSMNQAEIRGNSQKNINANKNKVINMQRNTPQLRQSQLIQQQIQKLQQQKQQDEFKDDQPQQQQQQQLPNQQNILNNNSFKKSSTLNNNNNNNIINNGNKNTNIIGNGSAIFNSNRSNLQQNSQQNSPFQTEEIHKKILNKQLYNNHLSMPKQNQQNTIFNANIFQTKQIPYNKGITHQGKGSNVIFIKNSDFQNKKNMPQIQKQKQQEIQVDPVEEMKKHPLYINLQKNLREANEQNQKLKLDLSKQQQTNKETQEKYQNLQKEKDKLQHKILNMDQKLRQYANKINEQQYHLQQLMRFYMQYQQQREEQLQEEGEGEGEIEEGEEGEEIQQQQNGRDIRQLMYFMQMQQEDQIPWNLLSPELQQQRLENEIDLDNMGYEEILELQEKIGYVSKGLTQEKIEQIPKIEFKENLKEISENCTICMEEFELEKEIKQLRCKHLFHIDCVNEWLQKEKVCPLCKNEVLEEKEMQEMVQQQIQQEEQKQNNENNQDMIDDEQNDDLEEDGQEDNQYQNQSDQSMYGPNLDLQQSDISYNENSQQYDQEQQYQGQDDDVQDNNEEIDDQQQYSSESDHNF